MKGTSVLKYDSKGKAAKAYRDLAGEVLRRWQSAIACATARSPSCSRRPRRGRAPSAPRQAAPRGRAIEGRAGRPPRGRCRRAARRPRPEPTDDRAMPRASARPALPGRDPRGRRGRRRLQRRQPHDRGRRRRASSSSPSTPTSSSCRCPTRRPRSTSAASTPRGSARAPIPRSAGRPPRTRYDRIKTVLRGSDMVFVTAGEGGGTGTGAAPVVARIAREVGALTVGIVTSPFGVRGQPARSAGASRAWRRCATAADTVIVIPNDRLLEVLEKGTTLVEAFRIADDVLRQGVQGICDLITLPGLINLDFADVRAVMSGAGTRDDGHRHGDRAATAPPRPRRGRSTSPLIDHEVRGARGILLSISGGSDLSLHEVNEAAEVVRAAADDRHQHHLRRLGRRAARRTDVGDGRRDRLLDRRDAGRRTARRRAAAGTAARATCSSRPASCSG